MSRSVHVFRCGRAMSPNSHVVKWLISSYRNVLQRNRIQEAEMAVPECLRRPLGSLEVMEPRIMLAATTFPDHDYLAAPTLTQPIKDALLAGLGSFATKLQALSDAGQFNSDVPGVLEYDKVFPFTPPKAKNLTEVLDAVDGSTFSGLITNQIIAHINGVPNGSA